MSDAAEQKLSLAAHYLSIDKPQRALDTLAQGGEDLPETPLFWELRARAFHDLERHADAATAAARGLEIDGEDVDLMRLRADALAATGHLADAERAILRALALQPEHVELLCSYALIAARGDQVEKATRLVERAHAIEPDSRRVEATRLILAHLRGEDRQARVHARTLVADAPDDPAAHYLAGFAESSHGRTDAAERHFRTAARLEPVDSDYAAAARQARFEAHPLLWPLRPFDKLGTAVTWIAAVATILGLQLLGFARASGIFALAYLALCVYSWVVPPMLRAWLRRRRS